MNSKSLYLFMRGVIRFFSILSTNFLSFLTLITIIFIYHIFWVAAFGTGGFLNHISQASSIRAYLTNNNDLIAKDILSNINNLDNISSAKYYSQKDAKAFAVANSPKVAGLDSFSEEFFPSFIEVIPTDYNDETLDYIVAEINNIKGIDEVSYGKEYIVKFKAISRGALIFIITMSILFAVAIIFVIYNTIKLSLYKYKEEIRLYALVGATGEFIAIPYLIGAFFLSFFAYIFSAIVFAMSFIPFNLSVLIPSGINIYNMPNPLYFIISLILISFIGIISANMSISSFLKQVPSINED